MNPKVLLLAGAFLIFACDADTSADAPDQAESTSPAAVAAEEATPATEEDDAPAGVHVQGSQGSVRITGEGVQVEGDDRVINVDGQGIQIGGHNLEVRQGSDSNTCSRGGCRVTCPADTVCTATCSGGGCTHTCESGASCTFTCSGGGCTRICEDGASCTLTCSGSGCTDS
jgi:hypothetical protein